MRKPLIIVYIACNKGEVESKGIPTTIDDGQQFD